MLLIVHCTMHSIALRRAAVLAIPAFIALTGAAVVAQAAAAETHIKSNITVNTTWTAAGSPYMLDAQIKVMPGVKLTIEPGVTVEFNATNTLALYVEGILTATGTAASPIVFTSSQGAAGLGTPGQYEGIIILSGNAASQFAYTGFFYGGSGSGGYYGYGELQLLKGSGVSVTHSIFENNAYAGLKNASTGTAEVSYSTFSNNGDGLSAIAAGPNGLNVTHSHITHNVQDGLFFNFLSETTAPTPSIVGNEITGNGRYGVNIQESCSSPTSAFPHGYGNDIYGNGPNAQHPLDGSELRTINTCEALHVDWTGNYWGAVQFVTGPEPFGTVKACEDTIPGYWYQSASFQPSGYLAYSSETESPEHPPYGPISTSHYVTWEPVVCTDKKVENLFFENMYNSFYLEPGQIATEYIPVPSG